MGHSSLSSSWCSWPETWWTLSSKPSTIIPASPGFVSNFAVLDLTYLRMTFWPMESLSPSSLSSIPRMEAMVTVVGGADKSTTCTKCPDGEWLMTYSVTDCFIAWPFKFFSIYLLDHHHYWWCVFKNSSQFEINPSRLFYNQRDLNCDFWGSLNDSVFTVIIIIETLGADC